MNPNPLLALILSLFPGLGHFYLNRKVRGALYAIGFCGGLFLLALMLISHAPNHLILFIFVCTAFVWGVNLLDMIVTLASGSAQRRSNPPYEGQSVQYDPNAATALPQSEHNERFFTIILSFVPGLGHLQIGLMQRGLTFLVSFFGLLVMVFFVTAMTGMKGFLVFLCALPVIWLYSLFDAVQMLNRKQRGEPIDDRSIFEEFEEGREAGRKSKMIATFLAVFPGAGHMYLGLQRRGLQYMAGFLLTLYILDVMHLSLFLFLLPIIWFYSLFDALQHISRYGREELQDQPLIAWFVNHQRWVGIGLLCLGAYYLLDRFLIQMLQRFLPEWQPIYWFDQYFQTLVVSIVLIGGGLKLLAGGKRSRGGEGR
jgi:hypothetical protein